MALVRCTCITALAVGDDGPGLAVTVADPTCCYVPHQLLTGDFLADL